MTSIPPNSFRIQARNFSASAFGNPSARPDDVDLVEVVHVHAETAHPLGGVDAGRVHPHGTAAPLPVDHAPKLGGPRDAQEVVPELGKGRGIRIVSVEDEVLDPHLFQGAAHDGPAHDPEGLQLRACPYDDGDVRPEGGHDCGVRVGPCADVNDQGVDGLATQLLGLLCHLVAVRAMAPRSTTFTPRLFNGFPNLGEIGFDPVDDAVRPCLVLRHGDDEADTGGLVFAKHFSPPPRDGNVLGIVLGNVTMPNTGCQTFFAVHGRLVELIGLIVNAAETRVRVRRVRRTWPRMPRNTVAALLRQDGLYLRELLRRELHVPGGTDTVFNLLRACSPR